MTVLNDFSSECCESLMEYLQLLALVYQVTDGDKIFYCCSPKVLTANYDCFLFNPHAINMQLPFYQEQILIARFFGFVRNVCRLYVGMMDRSEEYQCIRLIIQKNNLLSFNNHYMKLSLV